MVDSQETKKDSLSIGEGVTITGHVHTDGVIYLNGRIDGEVTAKEIYIGPAGCLSGTLRVENAEVSGSVGDDVTVTGRLALLETGSISGSVVWGLLEVKLGARIDAALAKYQAPREPVAAYTSSLKEDVISAAQPISLGVEPSIEAE